MIQTPPLPLEFVDSIKHQLGDQADVFFETYNQPFTRGIRFRNNHTSFISEDLLGSISYASNAYFLSADSIAGSSIYHEAGAFYIQEPSAMVPASVLAPEDGDLVLDLCAAPGGKSTQLAMSAKLGLLVSNEPVSSRAQILSSNIERMGIANCIVTSAYPDALASKWAKYFDKILVDAPCSGEGMFRKHPESRLEWNHDSPIHCAERQRSILDAAAVMLKPGGKLVYSTCTFNNTENEDTVLSFLNCHPDFSLVPFTVTGVANTDNGMMHLWPHLIKGEGHFVALLQKAATPEKDMPSDYSTAFKFPGKDLKGTCFSFLDQLGITVPRLAVWGSKIVCPPLSAPCLDGIKVLRVGIHIGELKGKIFVPDHALSHACEAKTIPLTAEQARSYLHGETIPYVEEERGYCIVSFNGFNLGFGKISDGMIKNHYPKGLRK